MSYTSPQVVPLKRKKTVSQNSSKSRKSVHQINSKRKKINPNPSKVVAIGSKIKKIPGWLKSLRILENGSTLLAFCLICTTLGVYGWTVLTQQTWSRQYRNLERLQRQERDFTATSESLKHQLTEEAQEGTSGLVSATPEKTLFLKETISSNNNFKKEENFSENKKSLPIIRPLGY
jgi:hypothetical protein